MRSKSWWLDYDITTNTVRKLERVLGRLVEGEDLKLWVLSGGGDLAAGTAIVDLLRTVPVTTVGTGEVCSMAVPILAAGTSGRRLLYPNCMLGLHAPFLTVIATDDPVSQATDLRVAESMRDRFYNLLAGVTGHSYMFWRKRLEGQSMRWIDAKEALKWNLADAII